MLLYNFDYLPELVRVELLDRLVQLSFFIVGYQLLWGWLGGVLLL